VELDASWSSSNANVGALLLNNVHTVLLVFHTCLKSVTYVCRGMGTSRRMGSSLNPSI
jgi:hypothetical protein